MKNGDIRASYVSLPEAKTSTFFRCPSRKSPVLSYLQLRYRTNLVKSLALTPPKRTWLAGKSTMNESMYFLLKMGDLPGSHVSFPGSTCSYQGIITHNPSLSLNNHPLKASMVAFGGDGTFKIPMFVTHSANGSWDKAVWTSHFSYQTCEPTESLSRLAIGWVR